MIEIVESAPGTVGNFVRALSRKNFWTNCFAARDPKSTMKGKIFTRR